MESCDIFDMHCHLAFAPNPAATAAALRAEGVGALCATVTPDEYQRARLSLKDATNVRVGVGLHPWWLSDGSCDENDVVMFSHFASHTPYIAEVGLDFASRRAETATKQRGEFARIALNSKGKYLSVHAVRSANVALDILEAAGAFPQGRAWRPGDAAVTFHWFSGLPAERARAIELGCFFSINPRMITSKRGVECIRAVPADKLLLETDLPPTAGTDLNAAEVRETLEDMLDRMSEFRGCSRRGLAATIAETSRMLLSL